MVYRIGGLIKFAKDKMNNKIRLLKSELETWLRTLDYIRQENVALKNCLAEIVSNDIEPEMLEEVEYFQNQLVDKDTVISLLRYDLAEQNKLLDRYAPENGSPNDISNKHSKLRGDMEKTEKEFSKLKYQFNNYFSENL